MRMRRRKRGPKPGSGRLGAERITLRLEAGTVARLRALAEVLARNPTTQRLRAADIARGALIHGLEMMEEDKRAE